MKTPTRILITTLAALFPLAHSSHAATLSIDTAEPTTDVLVSQAIGGSFTRAFSTTSTGATFQTGKGQSFLMPDTGDGATQFAVDRLTVQKNANQTFDANSQITLWVYEWNPDNNGNTGTGLTGGDGITDGDPFDGTGITNILENGSASSIANLTISSGAYLHFDFDTPLMLDENKAYGFLIGFEGLDTGGNNRFQMAIAPGGGVNEYADGTLWNANTSNNTLQSNQDFRFYVQGSVVPEPGSLALMVIGGLFIVRRRRG